MKNDKNTLVNIDIPDSLDKSLKNLTDQPTAYIGNFISDVFELIFGKFHHKMEIRRIEYQHKVDEFKKNIQQKIEAIPPEKLIEPDFQTVSQAVENAQYCLFSEELQEMFANLIANSINIDYGDKLHPSFSEIIKQMSPLDAKILKEFIAPVGTSLKSIVDLQLKISDEHSSTLVFRDLYISDDISCPPEKSSVSIASLYRLGLITITPF